MNKTPIGILLLVAVLLPGCANRYQQNVEQSLLLEENRRLYDALYVTHAQLEDLQHENDELREAATLARPGNGPSAPSSYRDEDEPPFVPPQVTVPPPGGGSSTAPAFLDDGAYRGNRDDRYGKTVQVSTTAPGELRLPEFPEEGEFPTWSPVR